MISNCKCGHVSLNHKPSDGCIHIGCHCTRFEPKEVARSISEAPDHVNDPKQTFASGATSTKQSADYTLIPPAAIERMAKRFTLGAEKHGRNNWRLGIGDEEFRRVRISHLIEHALKYANEGNSKGDDNLGAIGWAFATLSEMEDREPFRGTEVKP